MEIQAQPFYVYFFLVSDGVKRKGIKQNHVKILIRTKNDTFSFQIACHFPQFARMMLFLF